MKILGISAGFHDASISVIEDDQILFAGHSERYSRVKHDKNLCYGILREALSYGQPDHIAYYEQPLLKKSRQLFAGQYADAFNMNDISIKRQLNHKFPDLIRQSVKYSNHSHHLSHAASAFQTSPFKHATVIVIDAIGEWDTISIMAAAYDPQGKAYYRPLWKQRYPHSIGLLYSAVTAHVGLRPMDEEYILMGMAGYGRPIYLANMLDYAVEDMHTATLKHNFHAGIEDIFSNELVDCPDDKTEKEYNIAASTQSLAEILIEQILIKAKSFDWSENLVYSGGVALNCRANRLLGAYFDRVWIMPNPGDAGSSLGAAALVYGKQLDWQGPYLGADIAGPYPVDALIKELLTNKIVGVASGRAEFGPRALGNRSLLADPRGEEIKDKVNEIKQRQKFRPFAPVILEEHVNDYFDVPSGFVDTSYMQVVAACKYPGEYPAIVHIDGTSRIQTVSKNSKSGIRQLLEKWYELTGCPMLLNTSLNIRGEPMVNDILDGKRFEKKYNVKVCS
jgi:carbamoyltransferase